MRICLVSQEYPPETARGGIGTQTYLKAHGLAQRGHAVHVVSRGENRRAYQDGPVHVIRIPGSKTANTELADWVSYSVRVADELGVLHACTPLDLVDFPEWGCESYFHLINRTEWNRVPTTIQLHGPLVMTARMLGWPAIDSDFYRAGTQLEATCLRLADALYS